MRFIELDRVGEGDYYENVLKLGCGPSFVRNRAEEFEQMIRDQGLQFWFRFWITFIQNHGISEFYEVNDEIPGLVSGLFKSLHHHFVQVSNEEAITYCWNSIFSHGVSSRRILDEMYQFMELTFACALGEVFLKWLYAEDVGSHCRKRYWSVPKRYLDPDFKPGYLEQFLIGEWGTKLIELLGVTKHEVPWAIRWLKMPIEIIGDKKGLCAYHLEYTKVMGRKTEAWKLKIKQMRQAVNQADCKKKTDEIFPTKKKRKNRVRFFLSNSGRIVSPTDEPEEDKRQNSHAELIRSFCELESNIARQNSHEELMRSLCELESKFNNNVDLQNSHEQLIRSLCEIQSNIDSVDSDTGSCVTCPSYVIVPLKHSDTKTNDST